MLLNEFEVVMYKFLHPEWLFLLALPFILLLLPSLRSQSEAIYFPAFKNMSYPASSQKRLWKIAKWIGLYLGWIGLCIAIASPVFVPDTEKEVKEQRNILLATDISLSMETRDWNNDSLQTSISRWDAVKEMITFFTNARQGDRFAHVVFATEAYIQVPFTHDLQVITDLQENIKLGDAGSKTLIGNAIGVAINHFKSDSISRKMMLLITDGLDTNDGVSPIMMAEAAARDSVKIYTIAMGSPDKGFLNVNHKSLESIASITGGKSYQASSLDQLKAIFSEIDKLEPIKYEIPKDVPMVYLYPYPLSWALLIFAFAMLIHIIKLLR